MLKLRGGNQTKYMTNKNYYRYWNEINIYNYKKSFLSKDNLPYIKKFVNHSIKDNFYYEVIFGLLLDFVVEKNFARMHVRYLCIIVECVGFCG